MNVCDYIINELYENGITTYFVVTGGAIVPFINSIEKHHGAQYYCFQHEQSAAMAAEGYYRSCGKIAAVCTTSGPGVQNILNGVCGCWYDSIPAFFIAGQVNKKEDLTNFTSKPRQTGFQEMPVVDMFKSVTKKAIHVKNVDSVVPSLKTLLDRVYEARYGPVLMDLPVNIQMSDMPREEKPQVLKALDARRRRRHLPRPPAPTPVHIDCYNSKRPLLIFGHGVKLASSGDIAVRFAEKYNIPFLVSWGAFDICETDHPLRMGSPGVYGDRWANYAIQNADLLISVGSRLDSRQIGGNTKTFSNYSKKIMVDIDENELNKMSEKGVYIDKCINKCARRFLDDSVLENLNQDGNWVSTLNEWKDKYSKESSREGDSAVYDFLDTFFDEIPDDCIVIPDQGGNLVWTMQSAKLKPGQKLFTNFGNSSMGFALPAAIGAAIGSGKKVYCIDGDGGFQMNIQELLTVKKYDLPISIVILNNSGYGIIKQFQDSYFDSRYIATSQTDVFGDRVDFEAIAKAYGVKTLHDIPIPETQKIYPKLEFGNSLENMTPYIDFEEDMIVPVPPKRKLGWVNN